MKRDMNLIRELLLKLEDLHLDGNVYSVEPDGLVEGRSSDELSYHLLQLIDAGFLDGKRGLSGEFILRKITWNGHEFLADTRDPEIWHKSKERVKAVGGVGLSFLWEIAKAEIRSKLGLP